MTFTELALPFWLMVLSIIIFAIGYFGSRGKI